MIDCTALMSASALPTFAMAISQGPNETGQTLTFNLSLSGSTGGLTFTSGPSIDPSTGAVHSLDTGESIGNSFAVDETGGVYIVTDAALYRFDAAADGSPAVTWRATYPNDGTSKPGLFMALLKKYLPSASDKAEGGEELPDLDKRYKRAIDSRDRAKAFLDDQQKFAEKMKA